jgi:hypothetical protein
MDMALKPSLRFVAKRIAEAVERSAQGQGLAQGDYALAGTYDEKSDRISLTLGTDRKIDDRRWYADTLQEIRRAFPEAPQITMQIGIVVQKVTNLDEVYLNSMAAEDEFDLTLLLERSGPHS